MSASCAFGFDTEFQAYGSKIDLISLGMVREDGAEYYAVNAECDFAACEPWVAENVLPIVRRQPAFWKPYATIREEVEAFVGPQTPELWAWFADYDWVALCGLFGTLNELPRHWPQYCLDVKQWQVHMNQVALPEFDPAIDGGIEHDALVDARHTRRLWYYLKGLEELLIARALGQKLQ